MKMVKSLLLGSAAGLVAVAGAQAADLPVKAKPVEYVKVCSLYGAGFWYVPGTDTCLKIGSYLRVQTSWDAEGGGIPIGSGDSTAALSGRFTRTDTSELAYRVRASVSVDLRTQTEYGTLRSYLEIGQQVSTANNAGADNNAATADAIFFDRGFIQFAGFTVGRIRSYFDINSFAPYSYANSRVSGDTGAAGIYGLAYTAQFGNGVTASLSLEDGMAGTGARGHVIWDQTGTTFLPVAAVPANDSKGFTAPDVVGALRIDQAWGYAQVAAALHDASGAYYTTPDLVNAGHPADKLGFAVTGGFTLNDILGFKGDQVGMQACYSEGAAGYCTRALGPWQIYSSSNNAGFGWLADGVFGGSLLAGTATDVQLTSVWSIMGFVQHFWNPKWRTSLYGGYVEVDYNATATALINPVAVCGGLGAASTVITPLAGNSCNPDYSWWSVGTRTQWNPHPDLDIGVDVLWTHLNTAYKGPANFLLNGARPGVLGAAVDDQDVLSIYFRIQRNFLP